jgi:adenosylmethionine-8-amino-7-oxononanoate aminotransferase
MIGLEIVQDRESKAPFPRAARVTEAVIRAAKDRGVLLYSGTGLADGTDGDSILLGPPFIVTDAELATIARVVAEAVAEAAAGAGDH